MNEVNVKVHHIKNRSTFIENIINYMLALTICTFLNINVSITIYILTYIATTYLIAPRLAGVLLHFAADYFIQTEIIPKPKEPNGEKDFELYHQKVTVRWVSS